jgi:RNA polymerase sigma-70 factor (ECF subfamily)
MDESALIQGCRRRDRKSQRELYERFVERIYRLTLRLSGNPQDAADLTQETFVRAFERIGRFEGRSGVGTWLYRIATNEALQLFRARQRQDRHLRRLSQERPIAEEPDGAGARQDVEQALGRLSDPHRAILLLKYQEGLSYDEIAEVLEVSPGTVASRLNRARAELRTLLHAETEPVEETGKLSHPTQ